MSTLSLFDRPGLESEDADDEQKRDRVFRVSEVNRSVRFTLEDAWRDVWIEGELSDVTRAASGHIYFTLSDEDEPAQLRGVMFRSDARRARAPLDSGHRVRMRGTLSVYEPRGLYQLIARIALPAGAGDLAAQFERIRRKLASEGLFDPERKRALPRLPRTVGIVTSASGAALHDFVRVARGRCPMRLVVADCRVQGDGAPKSLVRALQAVQRLEPLDAVVICRGGGSAEELWAFNDEGLARAIAASRVPTVSAVGHEVDVTIADLVADVRASTPSNAAEIVVPERRTLETELETMQRRLQQALETRVGRDRLRLERLARRVSDPRHALGGLRRRLENGQALVARRMRRRLAAEREKLERLHGRLAKRDPRASLVRDRRRLTELRARLETGMRRVSAGRRRSLYETATVLRGHGPPMVERRRSELGELTARLEAMSPLKVLARGYAIALHDRTGKAVMRARDVEDGDGVTLRLAEGRLSTRVEGHPDTDADAAEHRE